VWPPRLALEDLAIPRPFHRLDVWPPRLALEDLAIPRPFHRLGVRPSLHDLHVRPSSRELEVRASLDAFPSLSELSDVGLPHPFETGASPHAPHPPLDNKKKIKQKKKNKQQNVIITNDNECIKRVCILLITQVENILSLLFCLPSLLSSLSFFHSLRLLSLLPTLSGHLCCLQTSTGWLIYSYCTCEDDISSYYPEVTTVFMA
jgi:hypothetical protein